MHGADRTQSERHGGASFLSGGGETGHLARRMDWSTTPLGPANKWQQSLRTAFDICLGSRFPIALYWGPQYVMLYNDSLLPMVGANKHPRAMGRPAFEVLPEIRGIIEPLLDHVRNTGEATWSEDLMLPLVRGAAAEESYFTFTYSPIHDETGAVGGVFCAVLETTEKVIEERRLRLLNALAQATQARTQEDAAAHAAAQIAQFPSDVPFALVYLLDAGEGTGRSARLVGVSSIAPGTPHSPPEIALSDDSVWPLSRAMGSDAPVIVDLRDAPSNSRGAAILPIDRSGGGELLGFVVVGLSPMLASGASYIRFHKLLASSLSQAVGNAAAYEAERQRAESLAELDRAKTTFFSNISHEFRTPLTLMLAPIQDMLEAPAGAPIDRRSIDLLYRNAVRLLKLVNTLLQFSRIEAGRAEAVYEPVDVSALTVDLASSFRAAVERAGIALVVDCPPLGEVLHVDRDMWEKVVLNLLSNAFKFTFEGEIGVRIRKEGDAAVLTVSDTGTGIEPAELPRLFERFHRIEGARSRSHEGSGIGLALIRELVRLHGGEIQVESTPGAGSWFAVKIPLGTAHLPADRVRGARSLPPTAIGARAFVDEAVRWDAGDGDQAPLTASFASALTAAEPSEERILFADDNADMRDYVARLLSDRWRVETVSNGVAALESIRRDPPALVLCDVMMPGLDGFALLRELRADPDLQTMPVIMLSARAGEEESEKGLVAGANDYIAKPFSARDLLVRVESTLVAARAAREKAAIESAQRTKLYRHFMQAPFPVAVFKGPNHVTEFANPATLAAWGVGSEIIGIPLGTAIPVLNDQPFIGWLDQVYATGAAYEGREVRANLPTGPGGALEEMYCNFVYAPLRDPEGKIEGIFLAAFDVTAQVRIRQESERAMRLLSEATEERARALEEAHRANKAKDEFLTTMSHELRTPLNAIVGWAKLLQTGHVAPEQTQKALDTIERNARMQARLIEDMLDLARIEQGKLVLSVGPTEMVRVIDAALEAVRPAAELKGVRLQPVLDSHATIVGDADRLQQVVWNLLSNAIKFTPRGGRVQARLHRERSYVEVTIADDGQGIEQDFLPHVFDRFRQADARLSRQAGGLGLGLAIVKSIVELHGGVVTAHSDGKDRGATFQVRLPTAPLRTKAPAPSEAPEVEGSTPLRFECPPALSALRILVVDDEPETRELLRYVLEQCESVVQTVGGARQALEALERDSFDVLVSDIGMPDIDGYSLIRAIRRLPAERGGTLPAVALTAYARSADRAQALRAGFDVHLTKPVDPAELLVVIATLVEGVRRRRQ